MRIPRRQLQPFTRRWPAGHPAVWMVLVAANVACFLTQNIVDLAGAGSVERLFGLSAYGVSRGFVWQFFTYAFLHHDPLHLLANMFLLYFAGREVEAILGPRHFLGIYFGGGLLGGLMQWAVVQRTLPPLDNLATLLGASACVLAVLIAFTTILPELELTCLLFFVIPIRLKAKYLAMSVIGASLVFLATKSLGNIGHWAHLGGCLFGWLYVKQLGYGNPLRIQKYFFEKRRQAERFDRMSPAQFISEEIDPILEKISHDGIKSLTRGQRRILEKGREKIEKGRH